MENFYVQFLLFCVVVNYDVQPELEADEEDQTEESQGGQLTLLLLLAAAATTTAITTNLVVGTTSESHCFHPFIRLLFISCHFLPCLDFLLKSF